MPSLAREDVTMKPAVDDEGESSQPDVTPRTRQPEHQQILTDRTAALSAANPSNGLTGSTGLMRPRLHPLPQAREMDDASYGSASGTSSISTPFQIQSTELKARYTGPSINTDDRRPSGESSTLSQTNSLVRADSADSTKRPPARPLDTSRSVRNGAPTSPMPLYSQQLFGEQQLCCPSGDVDSNSETEYVEQNDHQLDIAEALSLMKRKRPHPSKVVAVSEPSIADPAVVAATQDVIALLQMYGPLSYVQLRFNIETQFEGEESVPVKKLQQVLDIMVELGVIHIVEDGGSSAPTVSRTAPPASHLESKIDTTNNNNPVYSFGSGARRMDTVLPSDTLDEINDAGNEIFETRQRIEMLKSFLTVDHKAQSRKSEDDSSKKPSGTASSNPAPLTKEFANKALGQMLEKHPDIANDPSYVAALRLFNVNEAAEGAKAAGTKKRKRPQSNNSGPMEKNQTSESSALIDSKRNES